MKKLARSLAVIYLVALGIAFLGFLIDSDVPQNPLAYQLVEVFMLSLILFGLLAGLCGILFLMFYFLKTLMKKENQYSK